MNNDFDSIVVTFDMCMKNGGFYAVTKKGDLVTPECVALLLASGNIVTMDVDLVQGGNPIVEYDANGVKCIRYATFERAGFLWRYCGRCYYRKTQP